MRPTESFNAFRAFFLMETVCLTRMWRRGQFAFPDFLMVRWTTSPDKRRSNSLEGRGLWIPLIGC